MTDYVAELRKKRQTESVLKSIGTAERLAQQQQSVLQSIQSDSAARKSFNEYTANTRYGFGNVDLTNRPKYYNEDGSVSTVRSMSFYDEDEAREILVPTVASVGGTVRLLSDDEARARYYATGEHLGKFNTPEQATEYAMALHNAQQAQVERQRARTSFDFDEDEGTYRWNGKTYASREELTRAMNAAGLSAEEQTSVARKAQSSGSGVVLHNNRFMSTEEQAQAIERERLAAIDLTAQKKKLDELKAQLRTEKAKSAGGRTGGHRTDADRAAQDRIAADIRTLEHEMIQAETVQKADDFYRVWQKQDFDATARKGGAKAGNLVMRARRGQAKNLQEAESNDYRYTLMNDDEVRTYNYYFETDEKKAGEYLKFLEEELNRRQGVEQGEAVRGIENAAGRAAMTVAYGIGAGLDQFASGTRQFFSSDRLPTSAAQFGSAYIREDLADSGAKLPDWMGGASTAQAGYDFITTSANMAPSILLSAVTGGLGASAAVAQGVGAASLGVSAAGNAYSQALAEGYTKREARMYSTLIGASEACLQNVLGGVTALGTSALRTQGVETLIRNIDNSLLRIGANLGVNMLSEGTEEYLQDILEPVFRNMFFGENNDVKLWTPEATYSFILGALTAGLMDGMSTIRTDVQVNRMGAQIKGEHVADNLVEASLRLDHDTGAYQTAEKIKNKTLKENTHNVGELFLQYAEAGGDLSIFDAGVNDKGSIVFNAGTGGEDYQRMKEINRARESGQVETEKLDAVATDYLKLDQNMNLDTAQNKADIVLRYMDGEAVAPNEVRKLNLTQEGFRKLFETYTGVTLPEDFNRLSPKAQIETVLALQQNIPTLQPKEVYEAAAPDLSRVSPVDRSALQENTAPTQAQDGLTIDGFAQLYRATVNPNADDAEIMSEFQKFLGTLPGVEGLGENEAAAWRMQSLDGVTARINGEDVDFDTFRQIAMQQPGADQVTVGELREWFLEIAATQGNEKARNLVMGGANNGGTLSDRRPGDGNPGARTEGEAGRVEGSEGEGGTADGVGVAAGQGNTDGRHLGYETQARIITDLETNGLQTEEVEQSDGTTQRIVSADENERMDKLNPGLSELRHEAKTSGAELQLVADGIDTGTVDEDGKPVLASGKSNPAKKLIQAMVNHPRWNVVQLGWHEMFHFRYDTDSRFMKKADAFMDAMRASESLDSYIRTRYDSEAGPYTPLLKSYDENRADYYNEVCADLRGNMNRFGMPEEAFNALRETMMQSFGEGGVTEDARQSIAQAGLMLETESDVTPVHSVEEVAEKTYRTEGEITTSEGEIVSESDGNGHTRFSTSTYDQSGRQVLNTWMDEAVRKGDLTREDADAIRDSMEEIYKTAMTAKESDQYFPFSKWSDAKVVVDANGNPVFSVVKKNGEYVLNLDFSLVCKKRATLDAVLNALVKNGAINNMKLGEKEIVRINDLIRSYGFETACALCFVDSKRYRQAGVADSFVQIYNDMVKLIKPKEGKAVYNYHNFGGSMTATEQANGIETMSDAELNLSGLEKYIASHRPKTRKDGTTGQGTIAYRVASYLLEHPEGRKLLLRGDFMSSRGFDTIAQSNPDILKLFSAKKGAGGPKNTQSNVQYLNEILTRGIFNREKAYSVGGVRIQSFSDYVPRMVFDYVQMIGDLAAKKLPAHSYTKEELYVLQFGLTGIKINMSLVPDVVEGGVAPGLDADGNYAWKDGQSFGSQVGEAGSAMRGYHLAVEIQADPDYGRNCGTIAVGVSDAHIRKMMSDPAIRMIIPYHKSALSHTVAGMNNVDAFTDYTNFQKTRVHDAKSGKWRGLDPSKYASDKTLVEKLDVVDFNTLLQQGVDPRKAAEMYVRKCEELGLKPKFDQFAYKTYDGVIAEENGQQVVDENYYKLLTDFAVYGEDGAFNPQKDVRMDFPTVDSAFGSMDDLILRGLDEDALLEAKRDEDVPKIVDDILNGLGAKTTDGSPRETGVRYSVAGEQAIGANLTTLAKAKQLDRDGKTAEEVWNETKWWKGKDGRWRFEISDENMKLKDWLPNKRGKLEDFIEHDELFKAYPFLRGIDVIRDLPGGGAKGKSDAGRAIHLQSEKFLSGDDLKSTIAHEVQHQIQRYEDFAGGANLDKSYMSLFLEKANNMDEKTARHFLRIPTYDARVRFIERLMAADSRDERFADKHSSRLYDALYEHYQSAVGEQEARNTQARLGMTAAQRDTEAPYLAQEGLSVTNEANLYDEFLKKHEEYGKGLAPIFHPGYDKVRKERGWSGNLLLEKEADQSSVQTDLSEDVSSPAPGLAEQTSAEPADQRNTVGASEETSDRIGVQRPGREVNTNAEASAVAGASSMPEIAPDAAVERYEQATPVQKRAMTRSDLAYMERNPNSYRDSSSGEDVRYSVSPDAQDNFHPLRDENGEIKYVYKAFYARDGKLYPPMVSNISDVKNAVSKPVSGTMRGLDTPVGIVLTADVGKLGRGAEGELIRNSRGRLVVVNDKGGGTLAFRPGWHLGEWPDAKQFNKNSELGPRTVMPDALVFAKCEIAGDVDYQLQAMSLGVKENGKYDRTQAGLPRIPTNGYYKYRTNPDPQTAPWYITGAMRIVEILDDADCAEICAQYGVTPSPRESGKPIRLEDYGLKRGPVTAVEDITPYAKNEAAMANEQELRQALNDPAYADAYVGRTINFDDPEIIAELKRNRQDIDRYRALAEGGDYTNWRGEDERFSVADKDYNRTALLQESTVDRYLKDYAAPSSPNYAQAYIAWMSPKEFLDLTTSRQGRARIDSETTPLDVEGFGEATRHQPFQLRIDHETGEISGHEGRHRANALLRAGVERIPVLMFDSSNKYDKAPINELVLKGQDFGSNRSTAEVTARDLIPLNYANRDEIVKAFGTQPTLERMNERYNGAETVRYSVSPETEAKYDEAVSSDNMDEAQRLVDEAAKEAGYDTPKLYHGTRAFGFTAFDPSRSDDGISLFATDNPRTAETYSGETKRSRIKDTATVNADNLRGEQLLTEAQKNLKKYEGYELMTDAQKREQIAEKRDDIALARQDAVNFIRDHDGAFDAEKMEVMNRILSSLTELTTAENEDELWEAWNNYDSAIWDLKFMDESITQEFLESIGYRQLQVHKNQLNDFMYDGDIFIRDDGPYAFSYVFDNQLALELGAELHKGVYELYGKPGKQLVIDTEGANWNQIKPPDELNLYGPQRTRDIATAAKANGYDSVLFKNLRDNGGETGYNGESNIYIFFNPEDLKSADPVTYDMEGNAIPLSKRFDSRDDDIRYSVSPELKQWFELQKQYGTMPESKGSVRAAGVPQRTEKDNRVSRTAATVMGAEATPERRLDTIAQAVVDGKLSYEPIPNKLAENRARNKLKLRGWNDSVREWKEAVEQGRSGADLVAMGATLLNNAGNSEASGEEYVDLLTTYSDLLRRSGQAVQAAKILQKLTPEGKLYGIQKTIDKMNQKAMQKAKAGDFDPTTGEFNGITLDPGLVEAFNNAQTDEERNEIIDRMAQDVANKTKTTAWDRLTAWRYLNMLGNFRTQVRNILGNAGFQPARMLKDSVVGLTEAALQATGAKVDRTSSVLRDAATWKAAGDIFKEYQDAILAGGKYQDDTGTDFAGLVDEKRRIFGNTKYKLWNKTVGAALEGYRKGTNWAMDQGDALFCSFTFRDSLARFMAANHTTWDKASEELRTRGVNKAIRDAAEATYRDNNTIATFLSRAARGEGTPAIFKVLGEGVMPFRKTPANILMRSYEYSPLSIIGNTITDIQAATGRKTVSANEIIEQWAKTFTGTGLVALGYALASMGKLIGKAPDDDKDKALFDQQGYQAYSLLHNGHTYTLDWAAPEAIPLFLGANIAQEGLENGLSLKDGLDAIMAIGDPLFEMSMLQGVNDALESVGTYGVQNALVSFVANAAMSYASQFGSSTLAGQIERASDNTRMQTYVDKNDTLPVELQRQAGKFSAKTPGWDYNQIPYIDAWGDTQNNADTETWNVITQLFSPSYVSKVEQTETLNELSRLYDATGVSGVILEPPKKQFDIAGGKKYLTASEYLTYAITRGQTAKRTLADLFASPEYRAMSDDEKVTAVSEVYEYANQQAKAAVVGDFKPDSWVREMETGAKEHGISEATYTSLYTQTKDIVSLKDKNGKTVSNSKSLQIMAEIYATPGLSDEQVQYLAEALDVGKTVRGYSQKMVERKLAAMHRLYDEYN